MIRLVATPDRCPPRAAAAIAAMDRVCFPHDYPVDLGEAWWWVASVDGQAVAYAALRHSYADRGFLARVGVRPQWRGRRLHRRLIKAREAYARRLGMSRLVTYTAHENVASSNSLIASGYRLYRPAEEWGCDGALYWYRDI